MLSFTSVCAIVSVEISLYSTHNFKKKRKKKNRTDNQFLYYCYSLAAEIEISFNF